MNTPIIRPATEKDIPALGRLLYQVHKVHSDTRPDLFQPGARKYTDDQLRVILADPSTPVFVAETAGNVVGYAFCVYQHAPHSNSMTNVKTLYIDDLCVDSAARGQHVGTQLYEYLLRFAKETDCYNVTLNVWADNTAALRFYEKIGMKVQKLGMETIL